jgi:hypothetical protein
MLQSGILVLIYCHMPDRQRRALEYLMKPFLVGASLIALLSGAPALAQASSTPGTAAQNNQDVIVTAPIQQSETDVLQGTSVDWGNAGAAAGRVRHLVRAERVAADPARIPG